MGKKKEKETMKEKEFISNRGLGQ